MEDQLFSKVFSELADKSPLTDAEIARRLDVNRSTIARWKNGEQSPHLSKLNDIANLFDVDPLVFVSKEVGGIDIPQPTSAASKKLERDVAKELEKLMSDLESNTALAFLGEPMDEEDREYLKIALENSVRLSMQLAKKKFTPKKYRK